MKKGKQGEQCFPQTVEKPVIASQRARWRGNPFSKMFCFYPSLRKIGTFLENGFPRSLRSLGMTYTFLTRLVPRGGVYLTKIMSRVMSDRVFAPHMDMVSASSPPILSMYSFTPSSAPP